MVHPVVEADERSPFGRLTAEAYYARHGVTHFSSTFVNPRGLRIFTQRWVPSGGAPVLGAIAVVHGFTGESSWMVLLTAVHFAKRGFAVAAVDHQGHGFSEGLQPHIPDIGPVLNDCEAGFAPFRADYPPPLPCFLYGESLGGAIALLLHLRDKARCCCTSGTRSAIRSKSDTGLAREHRAAQGPQPQPLKQDVDARIGPAAAAVAGSRAAPPPCRPSNHHPGPGATRNGTTP